LGGRAPRFGLLLTFSDGGFRLIDVTGIGYPLLSVVGAQCARDCEYAPSFYRFDPS
jgi:hypothetical protein